MAVLAVLERRRASGKTHNTDALEIDRIGAALTLDDYKVVLYRNHPSGWVAEAPAIECSYALMPTRQQALAELARVFEMISEEFQEKGLPLPSDTTEILHA